MIDARELMRGAVIGAPLSIKDDPTSWGDAGNVPRSLVEATLIGVAKENALSGLARAFGNEAERIGTLMDAAVAEDGPLADLDGIWAAEIQGIRTGLPDLSPVAAAADWEARVETLKSIMHDVILAMVEGGGLDEAAAGQLDTLIALDPRLSHLADADVTIPAFLGGMPASTDGAVIAAESAEEFIWDEENDDVGLPGVHGGADAPVRDLSAGEDGRDSGAGREGVSDGDGAPVETGRRGRGKRNGKPVPKLCGLLETAGFQDKEIAAIMGIDKSTYSLMRSGKRPWQGLRDDVAEKLYREIVGREAALMDASSALRNDPDLRRPDGA